jgi:metal transporter CNNM
MAPFVQGLMWLLAPVGWPTAKLLDYLLGEDHGTTYKKAGLKTLVSLHRSLGETGQQLNADEVTIISAVLDLKEKPIGSIMTPMDDVFTLSLDDVLDETTMDEILSQGYSRIPIHHPDNDSNFVGMLLVKMLITYDPEDAKPVRDFALATLPETRPDTSCLDIVNFFQEGKSHMVLVSEYPGEDHGAIGVVTLEDVIEELIGEEIVDESDVFVDVHKAIRRSMAAPFRRIPKTFILADEPPTLNGGAPDLVDINESEILSPDDLQRAKTADNAPKKKELVGARRRSSANSVGGDSKVGRKAASTDEIKEHLKHLGPSNLASRPRTTRYNTVKIKPGTTATSKPDGRHTPVRRISESASEYQSGMGEGLLSSAGKSASGGVQALKQGNDAVSSSPNERRPQSANKAVQAGPPLEEHSDYSHNSAQNINQERPSARTMGSQSTIGSLPDSRQQSRSPYYHHKGPARSGSITENIVDTNGFRKVVLEMTSSSESNEEEDNSGANKGHHSYDDSKNSSTTKLRGGNEDTPSDHPDDSSKKKKRRRRKHGRGNGKGERQPLLGD